MALRHQITLDLPVRRTFFYLLKSNVVFFIKCYKKKQQLFLVEKTIFDIQLTLYKLLAILHLEYCPQMLCDTLIVQEDVQ